jgi:hypothetical protein
VEADRRCWSLVGEGPLRRHLSNNAECMRESENVYTDDGESKVYKGR